MAKKTRSTPPESREDWEAHDAMHTLMRAGEIVKDKKLLGRVRKQAAEHAKKMHDVASRAGALARRGLISDKAMSKMAGNRGQGGDVKDLEKTRPTA